MEPVLRFDVIPESTGWYLKVDCDEIWERPLDDLPSTVYSIIKDCFSLPKSSTSCSEYYRSCLDVLLPELRLSDVSDFTLRHKTFWASLVPSFMKIEMRPSATKKSLSDESRSLVFVLCFLDSVWCHCDWSPIELSIMNSSDSWRLD